MTGLLVPTNPERSFTMALNDSVSRLPKSIDYRRKGMVTSVKNQVKKKKESAQSALESRRVCLQQSPSLHHVKVSELLYSLNRRNAKQDEKH